MTLLEESRSFADDLVALRRDLHRRPEIGLELPQTQARVLAALDGLGLEIATGEGCSSVTAVLRGGRPGPAVLLRADMDALPVVEQTGLVFASHNGAMHACGHDLHMAGLVGAARLLSARRDELAGSVVFMFQPGEEGHGGASLMIDEGVLDAAGDRVVAAYGLHVSPGDRGVFTSRPGPFMASVSTLHVTVHGVGGHASRPAAVCDPVPALLELGTALNVMVTRRVPTFDPAVVSVTMLRASGAPNVIPPDASLTATVRTLSEETTGLVVAESRRLAEGIAAAHGCTAAVTFERLYPVTENDPDEHAFAHASLSELFGPDRVLHAEFPIMGSEDFSLVLREVPGCFLFLGVTPEGLDPAAQVSNHSPHVVHDDALLPDAAAALAELAVRRLERPDNPRGRRNHEEP